MPGQHLTQYVTHGTCISNSVKSHISSYAVLGQGF